MSYLCTLVVGSDPSAALAPFDRTEQCRPEFQQWVDEPEWAHVAISDRFYETESVGVILAEEGLRRHPEDFSRIGRYANPNGRWDWWTIGGRYRGLLKIRPGGHGILGAESDSCLPLNKVRPGYFDQARNRDIDWPGMIADAAAEADRILAEKANVSTATELIAKMGISSVFAGEVMRLPDDQARTRLINARTVTYAIVIGGRWIERETIGDLTVWPAKFRDLVSTIGPDELVTVVDVHD